MAGLLLSGLLELVSGSGLPALQKKPWEGYFVAHERRSFHIGIGCDGVGMITPMTRRGKAVSMTRTIRVQFAIEEVLPSGRVVVKQIQPESLETTEEATMDPETVKFTGKVTGDAAFEAVATFDGDRVELGGKLLDPGSLKNPLRFVVRVYFREVYRGQDLADREFQRKVKDDEMRLETVGGEREKIEMIDEVDVESLCGEGLSRMRVEMDGYDGRRFEFSASENSLIQVENNGEKPLVEGFLVRWLPDPAKDPEGKARFGIEIR